MRFKTEVAERDGWTKWVAPKMDGYKMACCDCGLVHDMEFKVVRVRREFRDGQWEEGKELDSNKFRVMFRVKRNNRSTAAIRRGQK